MIKISKGLKPSRRGELEITDINLTYLKKDLLRLNNLGEGFVWLDTGTPNALLEASNFIMAVEKRHGFKVGCIEEIAFKNNWITREQFAKIIDIYPSNNYGLHLKNVLNKI